MVFEKLQKIVVEWNYGVGREHGRLRNVQGILPVTPAYSVSDSAHYGL